MKALQNVFSVCLILSLILTGCAPANQGMDPTAQSVINTSVASTLSAVTTQLAKANQPTATPVPSATPAITVTPTVQVSEGEPPAATKATVCDWAAFVRDINYPDGTTVPPKTEFTKIWEIKNTGTCAWTPEYSLLWVGGNSMGAPATLPLTDKVVNPGETVQVSIPFVAPTELKISRSYWKFRNAKGEIFGITAPDGSEKPVWVEVMVGTWYNLMTNLCSASYHTSEGKTLACNGDPDSTLGAAYSLTNTKWADGSIEDEPVLVMVPPHVENGVIAAQFPPVVVFPWSRFQARMGCLADNPDCDVKLKITYSVDGGPEQVLYEEYHTYGATSRVDIPLNRYGLINQSTTFFLYVAANGDYKGDYIFWFNPRIDPRDPKRGW